MPTLTKGFLVLLLVTAGSVSVFGQTSPTVVTKGAPAGAYTFSNIDNKIYVDGVKYARTSAGINQAIADLVAATATNGGTVELTSGTYAISRTITITQMNVKLQCPAGSISFNGSNGGCDLKWTGVAGGTVVSIDTPNTSPIGGNGLDGLTIDCQNSAGVGLHIYSTRSSSFKHLEVFSCTGATAIDIGVDASVTASGGSQDTSLNTFEQIDTFKNGIGTDGWRLIGITDHDVSGNTFINVSGSGGENADGFRLENTDNNRWIKVDAGASGTGHAFHLTCMASATTQNMCAREETVYGLNTGSAGLYQDGVNLFFSTSNRIYGYELCNGTPLPTTSTVGGTASFDLLDCGDSNFSSDYFTNQGGNLYRIYSSAPNKILNWLLVPSGYAGWTFGTGSDNAFEIYDAGAPNRGQQRFRALPTVAGNAETLVQSIGTSPVSINSEANSGTGGFSVYSGGTSPSRVSWLDGLGNGRFKGAIADQGAACTNSELALSSAWGSMASVGKVVGTGQTCEWTITANGSGIGGNPMITDTLTNSLPSASVVCEMRMVGGTGSATLIDQTTLSATAPGFTFGGTPEPGLTYKVVRRCGP